MVDQNDAPSSMVNSTPPIGVRNAAATPAAVPIAAKSRLANNFPGKFGQENIQQHATDEGEEAVIELACGLVQITSIAG